jgi:Zn-dependent M32 family carboxypeptidase
MNEENFNPLKGWTREQIKSTLKAHSKTDLLKTALQWRVVAEAYAKELEKLNTDEDG